MSISKITITIVSIVLLFGMESEPASGKLCQVIDSSFNGAAESDSLASDRLRHRLRVTWGGGEPRKWQGTIRFLDAEISNPVTLGFSRDSAAFAKYEKNQIAIRQTSVSAFEGMEFDVVAEPNCKIVVELSGDDSDDNADQESVFEFDLSNVVSQDQIVVIDQQNNRLSITRAPGDFVQFKSTRKHMIFEPGERFEFEFRANQLRTKNHVDSCKIDIYTARNNQPYVETQTLPLRLNNQKSTSYVPFSVDVPKEEGVYNLRLQLDSGGDGGLTRFVRSKALEVREIQLVVVDRNINQTATGTEQLIAEFNPSDLRHNLVPQKFNQFSRAVGLTSAATTIGNYQFDRDRNQILLPVGGWQAIPIEIRESGRQHFIEVEYASNQPMTMGFSILQTDTSGQVPHFGAESGVRVPLEVSSRNAAAKPTRHRFSFWPENEQVFLLIANRDQKASCQYRKIRVYSASEAQDSTRTEQTRKLETRKRMLFYEQPMFAANFSSHDFFDQNFGQSITDWSTFLKGTRRLADHIKAIGGGGAFINVFGEGSSLMPLESVSCSPRYDSGVFSSSGHDPIRKDVVELIYRVFESEGLSFIPVMAFNQRFSEIEFGNRSDEPLVNNRLAVVSSDSANTPAYNPLSGAVRQSVNRVIAEFVDRYQQKDSYQGVAVICRPDTCTLLPGSNIAGYDETTLARFWKWKEQGGEHSAKEVTDVFQDQHFDDWLDWRAQEMSNWYQQMGRIVGANNSRAKLYLGFVDLFRNQEIASALSPSLHRPADIGQAMLRLGLDSKLPAQSDQIVFMQPDRFAPIQSLVSKRSDTVAQTSSGLDEWFNNSLYPASLFTQRSAWARFEKLENSGFFSEQDQPILRLQQLDLGGYWNRERFAQAILSSDSRMLVDGGVLLGTRVDPELRQFMMTFSELPARAFENVPHMKSPDEKHPVGVRYLRVGSSLYVYLVNASPWTATTQLDFRGDWGWLEKSRFLGGKVADASEVSSVNSEYSVRKIGEQKAELKIPPFGLIGLLCDDSAMRLTGYSYSYPQQAQNELRDSYYKLRSRLIASGNAKDIGVLRNPGFENGDFGNGWTSSDATNEQVKLQTQDAYQGRVSLSVHNQSSDSLWVRSNPFDQSETGRLSVSVWMKTENEQNQPPLRISVECNDAGSEYYRFAELGSLVVDKRLNQLTSGWKRYAVHFDDLPQDSSGSVRIGFDMMGPGKVWIDEVQIYDRWLDEKDLKAMTQIFASVGPMMRQQENFDQVRRFLNGYWPLFLREYFDESLPVVGQQEQINSNIMLQPAQSKNPIRSSMRRRFRRMVSPGIFQFR